MIAGYITTKEAAEKLGVSVGRVRQMIADGQLPSQKVGRDNFIKESDLSLVENRQVGRPKGYSPKGKQKIED